jgi:hypothetical protein
VTWTLTFVGWSWLAAWTARPVRVAPAGGWSRRSWGARWAGWLLLGLLIGIPARLQAANFSEYELKAVWMLNFARFTEWPSNAFPNAQAPLVVGVMGKDPFGRALEKAFEGKTVQGRRLQIRRLPPDADTCECHILFVAASERRRMRLLMEHLKGQAILSVSESDEFLEQGGVVNFVLKDNAVRFEINVKAAQAARLSLDANLLKVALTVRGRYE